jgi:ABC-type glycerol-3-phosphate transport system permease component
MKAKQSLTSKIRGWFPQEPLTKNFAANTSPAPKTKAELDKRLFKNGWIVNSIIVAVFLGVNTLLIRPHYNYNVSTEVTIHSFGIFIAALATTNLLLYWRYRKQLQTQGCR